MVSRGSKILNLLDIGLVNYQEAYTLQKSIWSKRLKNQIEDTLILVEHPPVITIGRGGSYDHLLWSEEDLRREGIEVLETDRGGDVTYHGPGQLVGYPILHLTQHVRDLHWVLCSYEEVFIQVLELYGLLGERIEGLTGVWVENEKVLAIGIGVRDWVTYHGFALNINPSLHHFQSIIPCGIVDRGVTSLEVLLGERRPEREEIIEGFLPIFLEAFSFTEMKRSNEESSLL